MGVDPDLRITAELPLEHWTLLLPNVMELEAFSLCFTKAPSVPPWD